MQISGISSIGQKNIISLKQQQQRKVVDKNLQEEKKPKKDNKKLYYGLGAGFILLSAFLFRDRIKRLFRSKTPTKVEPPKPEPPKIEPKKTEPPKINIEEENKKLVDTWYAMGEEIEKMPKNTEEERLAKRAKMSERLELLKEINEKNISIVRKKEYSLDPNVDTEAKKQYFRDLVMCSLTNAASQNDALLEYEKYGYKYWINKDLGRNFLTELLLVSSSNGWSDKKFVAKKFIDIAEKLMEYDPKGMRDGAKLAFVYKRFAIDMDEATTLRYIELAKKIFYQQEDMHSMKIRALDYHGESKEVQKGIAELEEILKDCPWHLTNVS